MTEKENIPKNEREAKVSCRRQLSPGEISMTNRVEENQLIPVCCRVESFTNSESPFTSSHFFPFWTFLSSHLCHIAAIFIVMSMLPPEKGRVLHQMKCLPPSGAYSSTVYPQCHFVYYFELMIPLVYAIQIYEDVLSRRWITCYPGSLSKVCLISLPCFLMVTKEFLLMLQMIRKHHHQIPLSTFASWRNLSFSQLRKMLV